MSLALKKGVRIAEKPGVDLTIDKLPFFDFKPVERILQIAAKILNGRISAQLMDSDEAIWHL